MDILVGSWFLDVSTQSMAGKIPGFWALRSTIELIVALPKGIYEHQLASESWKWFSGWWFRIFFIFTPKIGERIQFDEHIFQRGWFNHQQVLYAFMKIPGIFGIFGWYKFCMGIPH